MPIELIVRGFCCLRPGIEGFSESIRVRSIIGRFLEHSRIFYFAAGQRRPARRRVLHRLGRLDVPQPVDRLEVVVPVTARSGRERLWEILDVSLRDQRQAWLMESDGSYRQLRAQTPGEGPEGLGTHQTLIDLTRRRLSQAV